jgi:class 3 adenylate cyclase/tetratricopeptide (TPR) repeat protein/ABC-type transport system involved in cytochrome c biogenesis ATPase subunit
VLCNSGEVIFPSEFHRRPISSETQECDGVRQLFSLISSARSCDTRSLSDLRRKERYELHDIQSWLTSLGLEKYIPAFAEAEIDFATLPDLEEDDLKELGLPLGPRRKVWAAIKRLTAEPTATPSPQSPQTSTSPNFTKPESKQATDAERRHLTVMFVDLVGSTEMATRMDAEDMRDVITGYQNMVAGVISRYEGFVAKFMGDGVLCYFGWPRANEDDAERAVRAGLSIIAGIAKITAPDGRPLATRVGIATGVVIVGDLIGSGATQEAAVVGETPNLAARLQGIAELNQLVIPKETQRLLGGVFLLKSVGLQKLKGIANDVEAFVVEGEAKQESRFAAHHKGELKPIVGREREINLMLERWALARSGQGQLVVVSGEAGIGKSRITQAVIDRIAENDHRRMTFQCSPYHTDSAFYPITQQMSFVAGFGPTDGPDTRLDKLESLLGADHNVLKLMAPLMGLDGTARYGALDLSPAQQRAQMMQALMQLFVRQAEDKPLLLVYEDLHWIDPTSLELLETVLDEITDRQIMILSTARPTIEHGFGGHPIVTRFALNRLGREQIEAIALKLTSGKSMPDEIMEIIAQRTDGVPLFVEELTKTILESGALKEDGDRLVLNGALSEIAIPTTLHDSLMARLDRLQPIKEVAQTAACIGRAFDHALLAQITYHSESELAAALEGLIEAELIYRRGLPPEATYLFKHALVRDAAYESLLKERRRPVHTRILNALETDPNVSPEILAVHAEAAGLTDRAIDLWEAASKAAIARPAYDEAISHLGHAISLITPQLENSDGPLLERALSLRVSLAFSLLSRKGYGADETLAAFEKALALADRIGDTPLRYPIYYGLWIGMAIRGRLEDAWPRAKALIEQADKSSETAPRVVANRIAGASRWFMGDLIAADRYLEIALQLYDPVAHAGLANRFGQDVGVTIHIFTACNSLLMGKTKIALARLEDAERLARTTGHIPTYCYTLIIRALFGLFNRDLVDAERCLTEAIPLAHEHNLAAWQGYSAIVLEVLRAKNGDRTSLQRFHVADAHQISANTKMFLSQIRIEMGWSVLAMGMLEEAAELAASANQFVEQTSEAYQLSDLHRLEAALAIERSDVKAAERHFGKAIVVARRQGARLWELRAAIDLAKLLQDQGRVDEAVSLLKPIHDSIDDGDCPDDHAIANTLLASLTG